MPRSQLKLAARPANLTEEGSRSKSDTHVIEKVHALQEDISDTGSSSSDDDGENDWFKEANDTLVKVTTSPEPVCTDSLPITKTPVVDPPIKKKRRMSAARKKKRLMKEILTLQQQAEPLFMHAPVVRILKEIARETELGKQGVRFKKSAIATIKHGTQGFVDDLFLKAQRLVEHADRVTIMHKDLFLAVSYFPNQTAYERAILEARERFQKKKKQLQLQMEDV